MRNLIPVFISEQFHQGTTEGTFTAFTMNVDISGFTKLTETLMLHKKDGAEVLTDTINGIFEPIIEEIYNQGGSVSAFAGDSFTAIFKQNSSVSISTCNAVLKVAFFVQNLFARNEIVQTRLGDFKIGARIGLSYGDVHWGILGKNGKFTYYYKGQAIRSCIISEQHAKTGEIVVDSTVLTSALSTQKQIDFEKVFEGFFKLNLTGISLFTSVLQPGKNVELSRCNLEPFVFDSVLNFHGKAEFREVVSVFISFQEFETAGKLNDFVTRLIEDAYEFGGYFNKLEFGEKGQVALILFGAPKSYENNIRRAMNFILNLKSSSKVQFRSGVSSGTVYAGFIGGQRRCEYTAIGDTVNFSSRLLTGAELGEIRVSENIATSQNKFFEFVKLGDFQYKGTTQVATYELLSKREKLISRLFDGKIVGREDELKHLQQFSEPIFNNKFAGITYVYGEAGQGKSRLVWEFSKQIDVSWFFMPSEGILKKSFNPFNYFLLDYFDISVENSMALNKRNFNEKHERLFSELQSIRETKVDSVDYSVITEILKELTRSKSILAGYLGIEFENSLFHELDAKGRHENYLYAVKELIKAESIIAPVVIELEDAQWIDGDSKELLTILTRNIENFPIKILCLARYGDDAGEFSLELDSSVKTNSINLNVFTRRNTSDYSRMVLKTAKDLSDELLDYIYDKTDGNPFFIEQSLLHIKEMGLLQTDESNNLYFDMEKMQGIPSSIQAVLISRLDRLSDGLKEIIQTASVLGREFYIKILSHILREEKQLEDKLKHIEQEKIWLALSDISYIFKHALLRDSAYDMQLRSRLAELHSHAAVSYEEIFKTDLSEYFGVIAYHYEKSNDNDKAIYYLENAGDYAREHYRNDRSVKFYEQAISHLNYKILDDNESRTQFEMLIDIYLKKGEVLQLIGQWETALSDFQTACSMAEKIGDKKRLAMSEGKKGWQFCLIGKHTRALECYRKQLEISECLENPAGVSAASGGIGQVYWQTNRYDKAMVFYTKQLEIAESLGNSSEISQASGNMGNIYKNRGNYSEAMNCYTRQLAINEKKGDKEGISFALVNIGRIYEDKGDYNKALEYFTKVLVLARQMGNKRFISFAIGNIGIIYNSLDEYDKTINCYNEQYRLSQELGDKSGMAMSLGNTGNTYYSHGNYSRAIEYFTETLEIYRELNNKRGISIAVGLIGVISRKKGEYSKAIECFISKRNTCEELGDKLGLSNALGYLGDVYHSKNQLSKALDFYKQALLIDNEIGSKPLTINHLVGKANCLFDLREFEEARLCLESISSIALELDDQYYIFISQILDEKIRFKCSKRLEEKKQCIENLITKLSSQTEDDNFAELSYEISVMQNELNLNEEADYKGKAILLLEKLYKQTPDVIYLKWIAELQS